MNRKIIQITGRLWYYAPKPIAPFEAFFSATEWQEPLQFASIKCTSSRTQKLPNAGFTARMPATYNLTNSSDRSTLANSMLCDLYISLYAALFIADLSGEIAFRLAKQSVTNYQHIHLSLIPNTLLCLFMLPFS